MSSTTTDNNDQHPGSSREITPSKNDECTSCEQNNVDDITEGIGSAALLDDTSCANCGKEGNSDDMNTCNKCKQVMYCNAACKKKHRKKHKKACERRVAELFDKQLFKEVEPEECPICFLPLPLDADQTSFQVCCGKIVCNGCIYAMMMSDEGKDLCAFCRAPEATSNEEIIKRLKKLKGKDIGGAFNHLAGCYDDGLMGIPQDHQKANELFLKAGELGCSKGYFNLGCSYDSGMGVDIDHKKAKHYHELAAMNGHIKARYNLGCLEGNACNHERAFKHWIMAARAGHEKALNCVKQNYTRGLITKDDYEGTLRVCHERQKEMHSDMRDKAAVLEEMPFL